MKKYRQLLKEIKMPELKFLGKGMQSLVFDLNEKQVLKVYGKDIGVENIRRLKDFYKSLDTKNVDFSTPLLIELIETETKLLVIEKKLEGMCPNLSYLKKLQTSNLKNFFSSYVDALFSVQKIETNFLTIAEPLDLTGDFFEHRPYKNWAELISFNLRDKYDKSKDIFDLKVNNAEQLVELLSTRVSSYKNNNCLIHGDFFPANLMVNSQLKVTAILDFGILTTIGDPIFDISLGATFSDMYDQLKHFKIKKYVWELIKERISEEEYTRAQIYILVYSLISANMYKKNDPTDGHFSWCIENLNNKELLKYL